MSADADQLARARALMDELETLGAVSADLVALNDGLHNLAAYPADVAVALLSLLPFVSREPQPLDFIGDAMSANTASLQQILGLQATLGRIGDALDVRLGQLREAVASVRVPS